jgi:hypothetical protein
MILDRNIVTDLIPLVFFMYAAVDFNVFGTLALPPYLRAAFLGTSVATCLQKLGSLAAHTLCGCGPTLSHVVWFFDYCGIALNFLWNAPMAWLVAWGAPASAASEAALGWGVWCWLGVNLAVSVPAVAGTCWLAAAYQPAVAAKGGLGPTKGVSFRGVALGGGLVPGLTLAIFFAPNLLGTLAAGVFSDVRALALLALLGGALAVKERHLPERWFAARRRRTALDAGAVVARFDLSPLHSHCVWHLLVWLVQVLYLAIFARHLSGCAAAGHPHWAAASPAELFVNYTFAQEDTAGATVVVDGYGGAWLGMFGQGGFAGGGFGAAIDASFSFSM